MEICLVRHAIAVERGSSGHIDDRARPLTPEGRARMKEAAKGLKQLFNPESILTSPLLRARQTAEILEEACSVKPALAEGLGNGDHADVIRILTGLAVTRVALVGHEPWMSELLSLLLAGDVAAMSSTFKKGAAALVFSDGPPAPGRCTLEWLLQPLVLRRIGSRG